MTSKEFDTILTRRLSATRAVLASKAKEYAGPEDRLHNFKHAAAMLRTTPAKALAGMMSKHLVSVLDIVSADAAGRSPTRATLDEKIGDAVNYLILLEAVLTESASLRGDL